MTTKIGLALSGGGARGLTHIGVIKVLEENEIPIDIITGTSAGALFGGVYASGTSIEKIEKVSVSSGYRKILSLIFDPTRNTGGLVKGDKVAKFISKNLSKKRIENFPIKFGCVATDMISEKKIFFTKGDASNAIRASISFPGFFRPLKYKEMYLIDGGIIDPIPIDIAKKLGADIIIAVDATGTLKELKEKIRDGKNLSIADSLKFSIYRMGKELMEKSFKEVDAIKIKPNVGDISVFNFGSSKVMKRAIKEGEKSAKKKIEEIKEAIKNCQKK